MNIVKRYILNKTLKHLFLIDDEPIKFTRDENTQKSARALVEDELLKNVLKKVEQKAKSQLFNKSTHVDHIIFPKATLHAVSEIRKILVELATNTPFKETKNKKW